MADLEDVIDTEDAALLRQLIEDHLEYTGSTPARQVLSDWDRSLAKFKKVMPRDFRRVLEERKKAAELEVAHHG